LSHILVFYKHAGSADSTPGRILEVLDTLPYTCRTGDIGEYNIAYENRNTGVEFFLEYVDPMKATEVEAETRHYQGLEPAGLTARVDYLRPSFFGLETLPWVDHIRRELDLLILDPQSEGGSASGPAAYSVDTLIRTWDAGNSRATSTLRSQEGIEMAVAPRAVLQAWWHYITAFPDLEAHYHGGVAIPVPKLMKTGRGQVTILANWRLSETTVLPREVGTLFLERRRRRFGLLDILESGTVRAEKLLPLVRSGLFPREEPHPHLLYIPERILLSEEKAAMRIRLDTRTVLDPVLATRLTDVESDRGSKA